MPNILLICLFVAGLVIVLFAFFVKPTISANLIAAASLLIAAAGSLGTFLTVREMQEDRINRSQPSIYVDFTFQANGMVHFIVRNTSNNMARNVKIDFDVSPVDYSGKKLTEKGWLQNPIDIGPNSQEADFVDMSFNMLDGVKPTQFHITAHFQNEDGHECKPRVFNFDLTSKEDQILPPASSDDHIKKIADELERIRLKMDSLTKFGSLMTESYTEGVERIQREAKARTERFAQAQKDEESAKE